MKRSSAAAVLSILVLISLLGAAAVSGRGLVRIPAGHFGTAGDEILPPGWHLVPPFHRVTILASEGDGALPPLAVPNREGVKAEALLRFHYRASLATLTGVARGRRAGFRRLLEGAATTALADLTAGRSASELLDRASLDAPMTEAIARHMSEVGVEISSLRWEIRLPAEFRDGALQSRIRAQSHPTGIHLLLIGLDAADWESIDPLLASGRLPNLKSLLDSGIRGVLRSYNPMVSPLLWTTVATGKGPDVHGVADFSVIETKTGARVPIGSRYRKVKALWNILSDLDRSVVVVGWWASYPADHVRGVMISDRVAALSMLRDRESLAARPGYTYPQETLEELLPLFCRPSDIRLEELRRFADVSPQEYRSGLDWIAHPPAAADGGKKPPVQDPTGLLLKILAAARNYQAAALKLLERGPFDFAAVYFEGIDLVGHRFQHYRPPKMEMVGAGEFAKFSRVVSEYYVYQDRLLGELIRRSGPGTTVMVISDHGFKTGARRPEGVLPYTVDQPVEWHREDGVFILSGPGAARGRLSGRATLFDIAPTLLALLGAPVGADMPGRVLEQALDPGFLARHTPSRIPTYEGIGETRRSEEAGGSDAVSEEMMAQLRALGYVGDAPAPKRRAGPPGGGEADAAQEDTTVSYHRNLATYYLSRGDPRKAIDELNEANRRERLPKSYAMLSEAYHALGQQREALAALEEGWRQVPDSMAPDSILWYVQLSLDTGDPARGRRFLEEHRPRLEDSPAILQAAQGLLAEQSGETREAQRLYESALAADPTLVAAARPLAALYTKEGRLEALRPVLEAGLARSERIDEYHNLLGALDSRRGDKEAALAHFRRASELNPGDPRFSLNVGLTLMDLQRWEEARGVLEEASAKRPDGDLLLALGNVRLKLGAPEAALSAFQGAARAGADPTRTDLGTALSYVAMRRRDEALTFLRGRLATRPNDAPLQRLYRDIESHP